MKEPDESRIWKYLELPQVFQMRAGEIDITAKQHLRVCEKLASHLAKRKSNNPKEFEQVEYLKNFVVKSAELNEKTVALLEYIKSTIQEICEDTKALRDGANLNRIIRDQGEKITLTMKERDEAQAELNELKRERRKDTAAFK